MCHSHIYLGAAWDLEVKVKEDESQPGSMGSGSAGAGGMLHPCDRGAGFCLVFLSAQTASNIPALIVWADEPLWEC